MNPAFERAFQPPIETIHTYDYDSSNQDYLDREMFGADRFEPCSPPDFYCDGGCKQRFEPISVEDPWTTRPFVSTAFNLKALSPSNPELSQNNFDVMVVLTVLTGRTKLIVKN